VAWNAGFSSRAELQITFIEKLLRILVQSVDQRRIRSVFTSRQRGPAVQFYSPDSPLSFQAG
jgi:hypothetical protein